MKFDGNHVMTTNSEVNVGDTVVYKESPFIHECEVLELWNNEQEYGFKLKILKGREAGDVFTCSAAQGNHAYGGMWRLFDQGTY